MILNGKQYALVKNNCNNCKKCDLHVYPDLCGGLDFMPDFPCKIEGKARKIKDWMSVSFKEVK